jgi:hypothetical protein
VSARPGARGVEALSGSGRAPARGAALAGAATDVWGGAGVAARAWPLALAGAFLVLALAYVALVLPFDSPDENSHYEYAIRLGELGRVPTIDDRAQPLFERVRDYMVARGAGLWLPAPDGSRQIGFNLELGRQPPLYYLLPAALARLAPDDLGRQVRLMRLTSVLCGLGVVALGLAAGRAAFPDDRFTALALPAVAALTPGFLFISASLNNDNLANLGGAAAFLGLALLVRRGLEPRALAILAAGLLVGLAGKRTALALLPTAGLALLLAALWRLPSRPARAAVALVCLLVPLGLPLWGLAELDRAAGWQTARAGQTSRSPDGLLGEGAFLVVPDPSGRPGQLLQVLSAADVAGAGGSLTVSAWVRSLDGAAASARLAVDQGGRAASATVPVDATWRFVRVTYRPQGGGPVRVSLLAEPDGAGALFDGVVVAAGERVGIPEADDALARAGRWDGRPFANMVANGSAELTERGLRPWLGSLALALGAPPAVLVSLGSPDLLPAPLVVHRFQFTFETYLGRFGWLTLTMPDAVYWLAALLAVVALVGAVSRLARPTERVPLGLCALAAASALAVGLGPFLVGAMGDELPQGRYLYPAILPISGLVAAGLGRFVPAGRESLALALLLAGGVALNVLALTATLIPRYTGAV